MIDIPLSLYVHYPWCLRKCPYCDFNSYPLAEDLQDLYVSKLLQDLTTYATLVAPRKLISIFFGGGTPSLLRPDAVAKIIYAAQQQIGFAPDIEITLEANPGTLDQAKCQAYRQIGINRISLGVQSFAAKYLQLLGRIHTSDEAVAAIAAIKSAGFTNFNLDLMYGLPEQSFAASSEDLKTAITFAPSHLSWYQLTIEPETPYYTANIVLPDSDAIWEMEQQGKTILNAAGFTQYEVSAYARAPQWCTHNLNYWKFGDYIGIGAGAHSKITHANYIISRRWNLADPQKYLRATHSLLAGEKVISLQELPFEFMLNALRLYQPIPYALFQARTGLQLKSIESQLHQAVAMGFLELHSEHLTVTPLGHCFLNDLLELFVPGTDSL